MDPKLWDNPSEFRPSRFINAEGKIHKPEFFIPFGVGRRMCLGDVLARMELFLFFASLMHRFDVILPEGSEQPSLNGNPGVTIHPDSFLVCLKERPLESLVDDQTPIRIFGSNWKKIKPKQHRHVKSSYITSENFETTEKDFFLFAQFSNGHALKQLTILSIYLFKLL